MHNLREKTGLESAFKSSSEVVVAEVCWQGIPIVLGLPQQMHGWQPSFLIPRCPVDLIPQI